MVYDEGFEVNLEGRSYFAFSKYKYISDTDAESNCDKTLVGWYNDQNTGERGCYRAEKSEKIEATSSLHTTSVLQPVILSRYITSKEFIPLMG
jgi:cathepsin C